MEKIYREFRISFITMSTFNVTATFGDMKEMWDYLLDN